tara:strand:- start:290 stop:511 length:222 start_codon:yes stop_codon:yes gene_type:complete
MGKLREHCLAIHDQYSDEVLAHYARFLEFAWHNREIPNGYEDALDHINKRTGLKPFEIDFIIKQKIESIYEGY